VCGGGGSGSGGCIERSRLLTDGFLMIHRRIAAAARFTMLSEWIPKDANEANEMFTEVSCAILVGIAAGFGISPEELMSFSWWSTRMWAFSIKNGRTPVATITFKLFEEDEIKKVKKMGLLVD
jgi:hypothetical protein